MSKQNTDFLKGNTIKISYKSDLPTKKVGYFKIFKKRWFDEWKGLNMIQRSIMVSLWLYGAGTGQSWVAIRTLADMLNVDKDTIRLNIKKLEKMKYFKIKKHKGRGRYFNVYILLK